MFSGGPGCGGPCGEVVLEGLQGCNGAVEGGDGVVSLIPGDADGASVGSPFVPVFPLPGGLLGGFAGLAAGAAASAAQGAGFLVAVLA